MNLLKTRSDFSSSRLAISVGWVPSRPERAGVPDGSIEPLACPGIIQNQGLRLLSAGCDAGSASRTRRATGRFQGRPILVTLGAPPFSDRVPGAPSAGA